MATNPDSFSSWRTTRRPDSAAFPIVSSGSFANPYGPYHQTLPLVTELATVL